MTDKREDILVRLFELLGTDAYVSAQTCIRNRALSKQDDRPAIALLDGDERARLTGDRVGRGDGGRVQMSSQLMTMHPQIFVLPKSQLPLNETIGTVVSGLREQLVRVIANDPVLISLVGSNGSIAYMGMETDLKSGGTLDGQCRLDFAFTYVLDPSPTF